MFKGIELFSSLGEEALKTLEMFCQERFVNAGEVIFNKGDESTSMYIVSSGVLQAFDKDKILGYVKVGEFIGEMSLFDEPRVRTASVKAIENSKLIVLLSFSLEQLGRKHPEIILQIKEVITQRKKQNER